MHTPSFFVLLSLPDVFSGSSPLSPLHSDLQTSSPCGKLRCSEGCVKLFPVGSASARGRTRQVYTRLPRLTTFVATSSSDSSQMRLEYILVGFQNVDACKPHVDLRSQAVSLCQIITPVPGDLRTASIFSSKYCDAHLHQSQSIHTASRVCWRPPLRLDSSRVLPHHSTCRLAAIGKSW